MCKDCIIRHDLGYDCITGQDIGKNCITSQKDTSLDLSIHSSLICQSIYVYICIYIYMYAFMNIYPSIDDISIYVSIHLHRRSRQV